MSVLLGVRALGPGSALPSVILESVTTVSVVLSSSGVGSSVVVQSDVKPDTYAVKPTEEALASASIRILYMPSAWVLFIYQMSLTEVVLLTMGVWPEFAQVTFAILAVLVVVTCTCVMLQVPEELLKSKESIN